MKNAIQFYIARSKFFFACCVSWSYRIFIFYGKSINGILINIYVGIKREDFWEILLQYQFDTRITAVTGVLEYGIN